MSSGSSPKVSFTRPQRKSRAMHSTGEKVQAQPVPLISRAVARATAVQSASSHEQESASCVGNIVALYSIECPWMASMPTRSGMPRRVSSTASCMYCEISSSTPQRIEPRHCSLTALCRSKKTGSWFIWPIFSSMVMRLIRSATRASTGREGSL